MRLLDAALTLRLRRVSPVEAITQRVANTHPTTPAPTATPRRRPTPYELAISGAIRRYRPPPSLRSTIPLVFTRPS